ncbi:MAG: putative lipid II flippase FtsW [bacterium]
MWIERNLRFDLWLLLSVVSLTFLGIVMIYSTSSVTAGQLMHGESAYFLKKQLLAAGLGVSAMIAAMHFNHEKLRCFVFPLMVISIVLLVLVLVPGIGVEIKGSRRWVSLGPLNFQPSELARLALVIYLAYSLSKKQEQIKSFTYGLLPYLIISGLMMVLIFVEPDMGGALTLGIILFVMLFVAGVKLRYLFGLMVLSMPMTFYFIASAEYRWERMLATINPWKYRHDAGWQLVQSFLALGSGGITGAGLGEGRQKLFYLPDAHTDFIFAVVGEELGLAGVAAVVLLFITIAVRGGLIALRADTGFGTLLAFGLTIMIVVPAFINMAVVMGLVPTKGLVLPFISYGGSALCIYLTAAGILLNVSARMYEPG